MSRMEGAVFKDITAKEMQGSMGISKRRLILDILGFFIARAVVIGMQPLAIGYFAANISLGNRIGLYFMMLLGIFTKTTINEFVSYAVMFAIIWTGIIIYKKYTGNMEIGSVATAIISVIGIIVTYAIQIALGLQGKEIFKDVLIESGIAAAVIVLFYVGIRYAYSGDLQTYIDNEALISLALVASSALLGMIGIYMIDISLLEIVIISLVVTASYKYGAGAGALVGGGTGAVLGYEADQIILYIGAFCILGIFSGVFRKIGRIGSAVGIALGVFFIGNMYLPQFLEMHMLKALAIGIAVLILAPKELIDKINIIETESINKEKADELLQQMTEERLEKISEVFRKLGQTLETMVVNNANSEAKSPPNSKAITEIQDQLCKNCIRCKKCWIDNYYNTYSSVNHLVNEAQTEGKVNMLTIPDTLTSDCVRVKDLIREVNDIVSYHLSQKLLEHKLKEHKEVIANQLHEISEVISKFSDEIYKRSSIEKNLEKVIRDRLKNISVIVESVSVVGNESFRNEIYIVAKAYKKRSVTTREIAGVLSEIYGRRVIPAEGTRSIITRNGNIIKFIEDTYFKTMQAVSKLSKKGETISGDNFAFMHLSGGRLVSVLSDGMGSGEKACKESELVIELLEQLMNAGFKEQAAIKLINSILILRAVEDTFATIDMGIIDLYTGVCDFVKLGAATTFIKRDNWVETIKSTTLPVGIMKNVDFDQTTKKLYNGDVLVMVTDGVLDAVSGVDKEKFIEEVLMEKENSNPQEVADYLMRRIKVLCGNMPKDDMTVLAVEVMKRA